MAKAHPEADARSILKHAVECGDLVGHDEDGQAVLVLRLPPAALDQLAAFDVDGDPDVEDDTEDSCGCEDRKGEPDLGAPEANLEAANARFGNIDQDLAWATATADFEQDCEAEPELGWANPCQGDWAGASLEDADEADVIASARSAGKRRLAEIIGGAR